MLNSPIVFIKEPFCANGVVATVPVDLQTNGSMSYDQGFTEKYEQDLQTVPGALPIPRNQMNQLFLDVSGAAQNYQLQGSADWVLPGSMNAGPTAGYPLFSRVLHNYSSGGNKVYESQVPGNMVEPGLDATWLVISGNSGGVAIGTVIDFAGPKAPSGYVACDGSEVNRTGTYASLFAAITQTQTATTNSGNALLIALADTSQMYVGMKVEGTGISSGVTIVSVDSGTQVTLSSNSTATGTGVSVRFFSWGTAATGTFTLPNLNGKVTAGQAGQANESITTNTSTAVGQMGGGVSQSIGVNNLPSHTHSSPQGGSSTYLIGGVMSGTQGFASGSYQVDDTDQFTGANATSHDALPVIQPTAVMFKCIKY